MIWFSFRKYSLAAGRFFHYKRIYIKHKWTPFVKIEWR